MIMSKQFSFNVPPLWKVDLGTCTVPHHWPLSLTKEKKKKKKLTLTFPSCLREKFIRGKMITQRI